MLEVIRIFASNDEYSLVYEWFGAEGSNMALLQQQGRQFRLVKEGGR